MSVGTFEKATGVYWIRECGQTVSLYSQYGRRLSLSSYSPQYAVRTLTGCTAATGTTAHSTTAHSTMTRRWHNASSRGRRHDDCTSHDSMMTARRHDYDGTTTRTTARQRHDGTTTGLRPAKIPHMLVIPKGLSVYVRAVYQVRLAKSPSLVTPLVPSSITPNQSTGKTQQRTTAHDTAQRHSPTIHTESVRHSTMSVVTTAARRRHTTAR